VQFRIFCLSVYKMLDGKPEGKSPLGRLRCAWEETITMNFRDIGFVGLEFIHLAQDRDR
jgi:hypothetical protein